MSFWRLIKASSFISSLLFLGLSKRSRERLVADWLQFAKTNYRVGFLNIPRLWLIFSFVCTMPLIIRVGFLNITVASDRSTQGLFHFWIYFPFCQDIPENALELTGYITLQCVISRHRDSFLVFISSLPRHSRVCRGAYWLHHTASHSRWVCEYHCCVR